MVETLVQRVQKYKICCLRTQHCTLLILGAHAQRGLQCLSLFPSVCMCFLPQCGMRRPRSDKTSSMLHRLDFKSGDFCYTLGL